MKKILAVIFLVTLIGGWVYPLLGYIAFICMVLGIGTGFFWGRKWCALMCPRGSFYDVFLKPISPQKPIPRALTANIFRLAVLIFLMSMMAINLVTHWFDPYKIGRFFVVMVTVTTTAAIILALVIHARTWCAFCPVGSIITWFGKYSRKKKK